MYNVVKFLEENNDTIEVIPESWLNKATSQVWWPSHKISKQRFNSLIRCNSIPGKDWKKFSVELLYCAGKC